MAIRAVIFDLDGTIVDKFVHACMNIARKKKGKGQYLNNSKTRDLMKKLEMVFESKVDIPRIKVGLKQTIETLISEEALLFAKYLRNEINSWEPRLQNKVK